MTATSKKPNSEPKRAEHAAQSSRSGSSAAAEAKQIAKEFAPRKGAPPSAWGALANPKYWAIAAAAAIAVNAAAFYFLRVRGPAAPPPKRNLELVLGEFAYSRVDPKDKQLKHGQFVVTLHLSSNLDAAKFRDVHDQEKTLQDAVEDAMKRFRASDYADPRFTRVRNRLLERLNEELGFEGIEEVTVANVPDPEANQAQSNPSTDDQSASQPQADERNTASRSSNEHPATP